MVSGGVVSRGKGRNSAGTECKLQPRPVGPFFSYITSKSFYYPSDVSLQVGLADRTLMPGDVVRRMTNSDTQRGYCREIHVKADLKIIGNSRYVIKDVSSERLVPLVSMPRDNAVCLDSWVGSTKNIDEKLTLR